MAVIVIAMAVKGGKEKMWSSVQMEFWDKLCDVYGLDFLPSKVTHLYLSFLKSFSLRFLTLVSCFPCLFRLLYFHALIVMSIHFSFPSFWSVPYNAPPPFFLSLLVSSI